MQIRGRQRGREGEATHGDNELLKLNKWKLIDFFYNPEHFFLVFICLYNLFAREEQEEGAKMDVIGRMECPARSLRTSVCLKFRISGEHSTPILKAKCSHQSRSTGCMEFDYMRVCVAKQKVIELISSHFYSFCCGIESN